MSLDITGMGSVADLAKTVIERVWPEKLSDAEKAQARIQLEELLQQRENAVIEAQKSIIVSEMQQADGYTKRARPTVVYAGLAFIFLVHVLLPVVSWGAVLFGAQMPGMPDLTLPSEFWWAWTGVCGIWVVGRSAEKRGASSRIVSMITGGPK